MKRPTIPVVLSAALMLLAFVLVLGCTDLQQGAQDTGATTNTTTMVAASAPAESTSTTGATLPAPATPTSMAAAPAATTTTTGGSGLTILQIDPGLLQANPNIMQLDPNLLVAPTRYEDTHPYLHWEWEDVWKTQTNAECSAGTQKFSSTPYTWVGISFHGTGVQLIATMGANGGKLTAHLSGNGVNKVETIDLYSGTPTYQETVWYSGHLANGDYGLYFEWDGSNAGGSVVWVDAIDVWGTVTPP